MVCRISVKLVLGTNQETWMQKIFVHLSFWFCPRSSQFKNRTSCSMFFVQLFFYSFVSTFVYKNCYYTCSMHIIIFAHIAVFKLCFQLTEQQQQNVEVIDVLLCLFLMLLLWSQSVSFGLCVNSVCIFAQTCWARSNLPPGLRFLNVCARMLYFLSLCMGWFDLASEMVYNCDLSFELCINLLTMEFEHPMQLTGR